MVMTQREKKIITGLIGGIILFMYGIDPTFQPSNFGRVYADYGGIFVIMSIIWDMMVDKKRPHRYEVLVERL